jgi:predicted phage replisome organizer
VAEVKWIKIVTDIFDDEKILLIESMPEADAIIVIWFKLLCLAGKNNNKGVFTLNDRIAYNDEMLATIFRRPLNTIRLALKTFEQYGMVEIVEGIITIPNWSKHQTLDQIENRREYQREYMAKKRKEQKLLAEGNTCKPNSKPNSKPNVSPIEREREEEREIERDKDKEREKEEKSLSDKTIEILKFYEETTSMNISSQYQLIFGLVELYDIADIKEAISKSLGCGKKGKGALDYAKGILKNWASEGKEEKSGQSKQDNKTDTSELYDFSKFGG